MVDLWLIKNEANKRFTIKSDRVDPKDAFLNGALFALYLLSLNSCENCANRNEMHCSYDNWNVRFEYQMNIKNMKCDNWKGK